MSERSTRSQKYQYLYCEIPVADDRLVDYTNADGIKNLLNPFHYDETVLELEDKLKKRVLDLVKIHCTEHQKRIFGLVSDGYTQMEIADMLGIQQSSVTKCIVGNVTYDNGKKSSYGGIIRKMKRAVSEDWYCNEIVKQLAELKNPIE